MDRARAMIIAEQRQLMTLGFALIVFMLALLALSLHDYGTRLAPSFTTSEQLTSSSRLRFAPPAAPHPATARRAVD